MISCIFQKILQHNFFDLLIIRTKTTLFCSGSQIPYFVYLFFQSGMLKGRSRLKAFVGDPSEEINNLNEKFRWRRGKTVCSYLSPLIADNCCRHLCVNPGKHFTFLRLHDKLGCHGNCITAALWLLPAPDAAQENNNTNTVVSGI